MERGVLGDGCTSSNGLEAGGPADAWAGARLCELGKGPCGQRGWGWGGGRRQRTLKVVLKVMSATARVVRTGIAELDDWLPQSAAA